jgi:alpha-tubulin suppressor-like RCC1 family protein
MSWRACAVAAVLVVSSAGIGPADALETVVPGPPLDLMAARGDGAVALSWGVPLSDGGEAITDYQVDYRVKAAAAWEMWPDGVSAVPGATVAGLVNGTLYEFRVAAVNLVGPGEWSETTEARPAASPGAPGALVAEPGNTVVALSWEAPLSDGGEAITDYEVEYRLKDTGSWTGFLGGASAVPASTVTELTNGVDYEFRVAAVNAVGIGEWSATADAMPVAVPAAPEALMATRGNGLVTLSWGAPVLDGGGAIIDYQVDFRVKGTPAWETWPDGVSAVPGATVTGLANGALYEFRVAALNSVGAGEWSAVEARPATLPGIPWGLIGVRGDHAVALSWRPPVSDGGEAVTDYLVDYRPASSSSWNRLTDPVSADPHAGVSGLINGTLYEFRVAAVNAVGTGEWSEVIEVTPDQVVTEYQGFAPTQIYASLSTCALGADGGVKCWGDNDQGELGLGDTVNRGDDPREMGANLPFVDLGGPAVDISVSRHTCAVLASGEVKCWGDNSYGQLGLGDTTTRGDSPDEMGTNLPAVDLRGPAVAVSAGGGHTCALLVDGTVKCWGANWNGQLGLGDITDRGDEPGEMGVNLPAVDLGGPAVAVEAGSDFSCALLDTGAVKCWGGYGARMALGASEFLGDEPGEMGANLPTLDLGEPASAIATGSGHGCVLLASGSVRCWGYNRFGQAGLGISTEWVGLSSPVDLGEPAVAISAKEYHTCALLAYGAVKCWGYNEDGELGLGDTNHRGDQPGEMGADLPAVDLGEPAAAVAAGFDHSCALLTSGQLKCWGRSSLTGGLGYGDRVDRGDGPDEMGDRLPSVDLGWVWTGVQELIASPVTITVITETGTPVVGAQVEWESFNGSAASDAPKVTDAQGVATFVAMVSGPAYVQAGGASSSPAVRLTAAEASLFVDGAPLTVVLPGPPDVATRVVRVIWPDTTPAPGVTAQLREGLVSSIDLFGPGVSADYQASGFAGEALTDASGRARLKGFPTTGTANPDVRVEYVTGDLRRIQFGWFGADGVALVTLQEALPSPVTLRVRTQAGDRVVGASVGWQASDGSAASIADKTTDSHGEVSFDMVRGTAAVSISGGTLPSLSVAHGDASVSVDADLVAVVLPNPPEIVERLVRVVWAEGGPVVGAQVTLQDALTGGMTVVGATSSATFGVAGHHTNATTDSQGEARFIGFQREGSAIADLQVVVDDAGVRRTLTASFGADGIALVTMPAHTPVVHEEFAPVGFAAGEHICVLSSSGHVKCWGDNGWGQLGLGFGSGYLGASPGEMGAFLPTLDLDGAAEAVAAGPNHTCALLTSGAVKCWGFNAYGQLGLGDTDDRGDDPGEMGSNLPVVDLAGTATAVAVGAGASCALLVGGEIKCWGWNSSGQLGLGDTLNRGDAPGEMGVALPAVDVGGIAAAIAVGGNHTCALLTTGVVKCWGDNTLGQLGLGDTEDRGDQPGEMGAALPAVDLDGTAIAISAGSAHTCALLSSGAVKCWGANGNGNLGLGDRFNRGDEPGEMGENLPAADLGEVATAVSAGENHTCALLASGAVKCWGRNWAGQLGLGDNTIHGDETGEMGANLLPADLDGRALAVVAGSGRSCALLTTGLVKCWGWGAGLGTADYPGDAPDEMGGNLPPVDLGWVWSGTPVLLDDPVTVQVGTVGGAPLVTASVNWTGFDDSAQSSSPVLTDSGGSTSFPTMLDAPVTIRIDGGLSSATVRFLHGEACVFADDGPLSVQLPDPPDVTGQRIEVVLPNGVPVPEAQVIANKLTQSATRFGLRTWAAYQALESPSALTGANGTAQVSGFRIDGNPTVADLEVTFSDGELLQSKTGTFNLSGVTQVVLDFMPYVELDSTADVSVLAGAGTDIVATAVDEAGNPMASAPVVLEPANGAGQGGSAGLSSAGQVADRAGCTPKMSGVTDEAGRITLRLCPVRSGVWHVDGTSLVPSAPIRVRVVTAPARPVDVVGVPGNGRVILSWDLPSSNGGSPITDYVIQYRLAGTQTWTPWRDGQSTGRQARVTGLTNGTVYQFRVAAKNAAGRGAWSYVCSIGAGVPTRPRFPVASPDSAHVHLTWQSPTSASGAPITDYRVEFRPTGTGVWMTYQDGESTALEAEVSGLTNGVTYQFRVAAINSRGLGAWSATVQARPRASLGTAPSRVLLPQ